MAQRNTTPRTVNLTCESVAKVKEMKSRFGMSYQSIMERTLSWVASAPGDVQLVVLGLKDGEVKVAADKSD